MTRVIGKTLAHYQIVERIGAGGMGVVYKARDTHLDRFVALKVLPPEKVADRDRQRRFVPEAKAASALNHPNIIHIYDIANEDGFDFIAMEYVSGSTLDDLIGRKGIRLGEALGYAVQIADALNRAHSAGIIHRDLKPANIMASTDGVVKLLDFGLAKLTEPLPAGEGSTQTISAVSETGTIVGTVAYMSPEQAQGRTVDARSDIFSFGSVLYEMLTGKRAFQGEAAALTIASIIRQEPASLASSLRDVPPELERVLARCLPKDPQRRWQSMADLKIALLELKEDSDSGKLASAATPSARRPFPLRYILFACAVLIAVAAVIVFVFLRKEPRPSESEFTRLTFDTGLTRYPAISHDGKLMAYASDRSGDGNLDIYVQQVGRTEAVRRTRHEADELQPAFSPDGTRIVFRSERDGGGIYIFDSLVGEERRIADHGWHPTFSPDGTTILYTEVADPHSFGGSKMYLLPSQGSEPKPFQPEFRVSSHPSSGPIALWSPDGKFIFFPGAKAASRPICEDCVVAGFFADATDAIVQYGSDLVRQDLARGGRIPLVRASPGTLRDAILSPDDRWLAFQLARPSGGYAIYVCPVRNQLVPEPEWLLIAEESRYQQSPRWSADGNVIYFLSERDGYSCIWAQRLNPVTKKPADSAFAVYHEHRARHPINLPRNWGAISVAKDMLVFGIGDTTGNIYLTRLNPK